MRERKLPNILHYGEYSSKTTLMYLPNFISLSMSHILWGRWARLMGSSGTVYLLINGWHALIALCRRILKTQIEIRNACFFDFDFFLYREFSLPIPIN